ncbi:MAG: hypothetical protein CM1200mP20_13800 [Pseudomonadota bacterium]|nr:MAG: hypothetical protein CM1200mP20_13800 [Pseudomonadota bacterium]
MTFLVSHATLGTRRFHAPAHQAALPLHWQLVQPGRKRFGASAGPFVTRQVSVGGSDSGQVLERYPPTPGHGLLSTVRGRPMARNVGDVAMLLDVMAGRHPKDPISLPRTIESYESAAEAPGTTPAGRFFPPSWNHTGRTGDRGDLRAGRETL